MARGPSGHQPVRPLHGGFVCTAVALVLLVVCVELLGCAADGERSSVALEREVGRVSEASVQVSGGQVIVRLAPQGS